MSDKENPLQSLYYNNATKALDGLPVEAKEQILQKGETISSGEPWFEQVKTDVASEKSSSESSSS